MRKEGRKEEGKEGRKEGGKEGRKKGRKENTDFIRSYLSI